MRLKDESGTIKIVQAVWIENDLPNVYFIDQRFIPFKVDILTSRTPKITSEFISDMVIRGAPSIGAAAAYGVLQSVFLNNDLPKTQKLKNLQLDINILRQSRPTAIDLNNTLNRLSNVIKATNAEFTSVKNEVTMIVNEIITECKSIANHGKSILEDGFNVLHHCHTGALATVDVGTALGVIIQSFKDGVNLHVYVNETRPRLQGGRITAWELAQEEVPHTLISDSVSASLMKAGKIDVVIVGSDRITMNGDFANKIGTYAMAVLAKYHHIPFYIAAPFSTFDRSLESADDIPIETRDSKELTHALNEDLERKQITHSSNVLNPAFDITPNTLLSGIITPKGIIRPPFKENITKILGL